MEIIITSAIRILITYFSLLYLTRLMGRKMISQMTFFDFVVGVIVGSVAANMSVDKQQSFTSGITILFVLTLTVLLIDYINLKSFFALKNTESEPVVVIKNGLIVDKNMKRTRLTIRDLMMLLRQKNVFNINDVEFAVFEIDGKLSVLLKSQKRPVVPADLGIDTKYTGLTSDVILDGKIMTENLQSINLNEDWLINEIKKRGVSGVDDVFYGGLDTQGNLYLSLNSKGEETHGKYGLE